MTEVTPFPVSDGRVPTVISVCGAIVDDDDDERVLSGTGAVVAGRMMFLLVLLLLLTTDGDDRDVVVVVTIRGLGTKLGVSDDNDGGVDDVMLALRLDESVVCEVFCWGVFGTVAGCLFTIAVGEEEATVEAGR